MIWNEKIKSLRLQSGLTLKDVAKKLNISEATAQRYENSNGIKNIPYEAIEKYAKLFKVSPSYFMGWETIPDSDDKQPRIVRIPVLGYVAAGIPIEEIEDVIDWEEIPKDWLRGGKKYFALRIRGDSMEPRMYDGDVVIVEKQDDAESGEYVIAAINGDHATCKRLMKYNDSIALLSLNSKYDPMIFTNDEVMEKPITILGVVREIRGKMKGM